MDELTLLNWKRRVFALYAEVRADPDPEHAWQHWRDTRDRLFREHPQSPIPVDERAGYAGAPCFDYDPALRAIATVERAEHERREIATSGTSPYAFLRFARAHFTLGGAERSLDLYWLEAYAGTSGSDTYAAGRYLLDTVKCADLGERNGRLVLDFNFAYNPSCSYDPRWVCPLAPPGNRLSDPIRAGERLP
jgi:uncharacterized protein (DUF1684 family)